MIAVHCGESGDHAGAHRRTETGGDFLEDAFSQRNPSGEVWRQASAYDRSSMYFEVLPLFNTCATQTGHVSEKNGVDSQSAILASNETEEKRQMYHRVENLPYTEPA